MLYCYCEVKLMDQQKACLGYSYWELPEGLEDISFEEIREYEEEDE